MSSNAEIAERLAHFATNIERWRAEAARLTLEVSQARRDNTQIGRLIALEETATEIYADVASFRQTIDEIAQKSPAAAAELAGVNDALHLVLLEITELGIRFYKAQSTLPDLPETPAP
jgi:predicted  nucleic acid-binding Zn-ribbon protein